MEQLISYFMSALGVDAEAALKLAQETVTKQKGEIGHGYTPVSAAPIVAPDIHASPKPPPMPSVPFPTNPKAQHAYDLWTKEKKGDPFHAAELEYLREQAPADYYAGLAMRDREQAVALNRDMNKAGSKAPRREEGKSVYDELVKLYSDSGKK